MKFHLPAWQINRDSTQQRHAAKVRERERETVRVCEREGESICMGMRSKEQPEDIKQ